MTISMSVNTPPEPRFPLGRLVATIGALEALVNANDDLLPYVSRHATGDWGDLTASDRQENEFSVGKALRILSAYHLRDGVKIWIITEADRSSTTVLLPEEY